MRVLQPLSALFFPHHCCLCEAASTDPQQVLCTTCRRQLQIQPGSSLLAILDMAGKASAVTCCAAAPFTAPLDQVIHEFKYPTTGLAGLNTTSKRLLNTLLLESARCTAAAPKAIVPIPLHRKRLQQRGFNPACVLARTLARNYDIPCLPVALKRIRDTPSQTGLRRAARRTNVKGAFVYQGKRPAPQAVWLVDDVVTTGATTEEAARVLHEAGVQEVTVICVARTPLRSDRTLR